MSESKQPVDHLVHRFAVATCFVALLPIGIGTVVTTLKAGMAFADWPTSDGHNMLLYPWLNDLRHTDRFTEHGHRLAGMVIGLTSIALVVIAFLREKKRWVRNYTLIILLSVIAQGLLGGARVLMDANLLAMVHSITGALFFSLCIVFAMLTGRRWSESKTVPACLSLAASLMVLLLPLLVIVQYWMGGMFRHLGTMMFEHLVGAVVVSVSGFCCCVLLMRSTSSEYNRAGKLILGALLLQLCLGAGAWLTKLNVPALGWVASTGSPASVIFRSSHTIGGMVLLTSSVLAAVHVGRAFSWYTVADQLQLNSSKEGLA